MLGDVNKELLSIVPPEDVLGGHVYQSCAVVGSSGILLHYTHGPEIDKHEMVGPLLRDAASDACPTTRVESVLFFPRLRLVWMSV